MIVEDCQKVADRLLENLAALGADGPPPSFGIGAADLDLQDSPPRIVFVPTTGQTGKDRVGAGRSTGFDNPKNIWTRHLRIEAHVWAGGITETEQLANHLIATVEETHGTAWSVVGEEWDTKGTTDAGNMTVVVFEARMPWTRELLPMVKATTPVPDGTMLAQVRP